MLSHIHNKRLPAKAKAARSSLNALVFNDLADGYTPINSTRQVIKDDAHLRLLSYLYIYSMSKHSVHSPAMFK
jgi:hypothetical protein